MRELHTVRGAHIADAEGAYRDTLMPLLAKGDDARLAWYFTQAHGTGPAYTVVAITAVVDGAAWERLALRIHSGDLRRWAADLDALRYDGEASVLVPVDWSPLQRLDLGEVPATPQQHPPSLYMEDTGRPHASLDEYIRFLDVGYRQRIATRPSGERLLDITACFRVAHGTADRRQAVLLQRIVDPQRLLSVLATPPAAHGETTDAYMRDALRHRDTWESRLLRTTTWSPLS